MVPIKNIGNLPPEFRRTERNQKQSQLEKSAANSKQAQTIADSKQVSPQDQVKLSDSARTLLQRDAEIQRYTADVPSTETLSASDKQEIETNIKNGFYASPEVAKDIAGKLSDTEKTHVGEKETYSLSPTRFQEVIEKIREGQYESSEVLDVISERILKDL